MNTQPTVLPWHLKAAKEITSYYSPSKYAQNLDTPEVVAIIARRDPHATTLRLLERALSHTMSTETGRIIVQDAIRAHLAAMKGTQ